MAAAIQRRPTPVLRRLVEEEAPEDLVILANTSPDAPNAALDLAGQVTFPSGQAKLCFGPATEHGVEETGLIGHWLKERKVAAPGRIGACDEEASIDRLDGILVTRRAIGQLAPALYNAVASRLQAGGMQGFVVVSSAERRDVRDRRELARSATEQAITADRPGFGYAAFSNGSSTACIVDDASATPAWQSLLQDRREDVQADLGREFNGRVAIADANLAYIGARRGSCGLVIADAGQLRTIFQAARRDRVDAQYGAIWFTPDAVEAAQERLRAAQDAATVAQAEASQRATREGSCRRGPRSRQAPCERNKRSASVRPTRRTQSRSGT